MKLAYLPIWLLFLFCVFYKMSFQSYKAIDYDYLTKNNTRRLKGLLALIILLDHIAAIIEPEDSIFRLFHSIGFLAVALFFFLSGYAVEKQRCARKDYLNYNFILNKFVSLIIPMYIINIIYVLGELSLNIQNINMGKQIGFYIFDLFGLYIINNPTWYIRSLFLMLILYFFVKKYITNPILSDLLLFIGILFFTVYRCMTWNSGTGQEWGMLFCFWTGVIWGENESKITAFIKEKYPVCLVGSILSTILFCGMFLLNYDNLTGKLLFRNVGTACFVIMATILLMTVRLNNSICQKLGTISLEIYLIHYLFVNIVTRYDNSVLAVYVSIIATIISACLLHPLIVRVTKNFKGAKESK